MRHKLFLFLIRGVVQGVGFRPYIRNACEQSGLVGSVRNTGSGVLVLVNKKRAFQKILQNIPPTAEIHSVSITKKSVSLLPKKFTIQKSSGKGFAEIPPDFFTCPTCVKEMRNPNNRRFGYFFTTCVHCGPRFTIIEQSPYDRKNTSMRKFSLCKRCEKEYSDPLDRRYHAQTIACPHCGPTLSLFKKNIPKTVARGDHAIKMAVQKIRAGKIISVKGVGGFHLICLAEKKTAQKLKHLTGRTDKPFAVLCKDIPMARTIAHVSKMTRKILLSKERPIVICPKKRPLEEISELNTVGIMLPYTALHYLLLDSLREPLICTSSNSSGHPITTKKSEQFSDYTLSHNRSILSPIDDSLIKVIKEKPLLIRRSRGYVPRSMEIAGVPQKTILALGAEMNATFCLLQDKRVTLSQYLGNTSHPKSLKRYIQCLEKFLSLTRARPEHILCDLHPSYETVKLGKILSEKWGVPLTRVQHHKAHAYGVATEHKLKKFVALVCDGNGYGDDGTLWGGEVFLEDKRIGHLEPQRQLGGDLATKYPDRMLYSILRKFLSQEEVAKIFIKKHNKKELFIWNKQLEMNINAPETSSCGRILDAGATLLGLPTERTYDGRGAMLLESNSSIPYNFKPRLQGNILLTTPLFQFLIKNLDRDRHRLAATIEYYLARGLYEIASQYNLPITFSGGCAYNTIMTRYLLNHNVLINKNIPPGDGGISFGQIAYFINKFSEPMCHSAQTKV